VPLPVPLAPAVTVIQLALLVAVQLQPEPAVTATLAAPPVNVALGLVGETPNVQGAAACVTVIVWPAAVSVPVRPLVAVFAATL
jgi:hypothetical protein